GVLVVDRRPPRGQRGVPRLRPGPGGREDDGGEHGEDGHRQQRQSSCHGRTLAAGNRRRIDGGEISPAVRGRRPLWTPMTWQKTLAVRMIRPAPGYVIQDAGPFPGRRGPAPAF